MKRRFESGAVVLAKVGDGLEVGLETAQEPADFGLAGGLGFAPAAGADTLEVAVEVKLAEVGRVIGRPVALGWACVKPRA